MKKESELITPVSKGGVPGESQEAGQADQMALKAYLIKENQFTGGPDDSWESLTLCEFDTPQGFIWSSKLKPKVSGQRSLNIIVDHLRHSPSGKISALQGCWVPGMIPAWQTATPKVQGNWLPCRSCGELVEALVRCKGPRSLKISLNRAQPDLKACLKALKKLGLLCAEEIHIQLHGESSAKEEELLKTLRSLPIGYYGDVDSDMLHNIASRIENGELIGYTGGKDPVNTLREKAKSVEKGHSWGEISIRALPKGTTTWRWLVQGHLDGLSTDLSFWAVEKEPDTNSGKSKTHIQRSGDRPTYLRSSPWINLLTQTPEEEQWLLRTTNTINNSKLERALESYGGIILLDKNIKLIESEDVAYLPESENTRIRVAPRDMAWEKELTAQIEHSQLQALIPRGKGKLQLCLGKAGNWEGWRHQRLEKSWPLSHEWKKAEAREPTYPLQARDEYHALWILRTLSWDTLEIWIDREHQKNGKALLEHLASAGTLQGSEISVHTETQGADNKLLRTSLEKWRPGEKELNTEGIEEATTDANTLLWISGNNSYKDLLKALQENPPEKLSIKHTAWRWQSHKWWIQGEVKGKQGNILFTISNESGQLLKGACEEIWIGEQELDGPWFTPRDKEEARWFIENNDHASIVVRAGEKREKDLNLKEFHLAEKDPNRLFAKTSLITQKETANSGQRETACKSFQKNTPLQEEQTLSLGCFLPGEYAAIRLIARGGAKNTEDIEKIISGNNMQNPQRNCTPSRSGMIVWWKTEGEEDPWQEAVRLACQASIGSRGYYEAHAWGGNKEQLEALLSSCRLLLRGFGENT